MSKENQANIAKKMVTMSDYTEYNRLAERDFRDAVRKPETKDGEILAGYSFYHFTYSVLSADKEGRVSGALWKASKRCTDCRGYGEIVCESCGNLEDCKTCGGVGITMDDRNVLVTNMSGVVL
jgi:hypothetical protein